MGFRGKIMEFCEKISGFYPTKIYSSITQPGFCRKGLENFHPNLNFPIFRV